MAHRVTLTPGDRIGPEVAEAARWALEATGVAFEWYVQDAGRWAAEAEVRPLPDRMLDSIGTTMAMMLWVPRCSST